MHPLSAQASESPHHSPGPDSAHAGADPVAGTALSLVTLHNVLSLAKRRWRLVLGVALVTALFVTAVVVLQAPVYRSRAAIRLADPERPLVVGMEEPVVPKDRTINPVLILVELLRSRAVIGEVVDSLSLRARPLDGFLSLSRLSPTGFVELRAAPHARTDTIALEFDPETVTLRTREASVEGRYGEPLTQGAITVVVHRRPSVDRVAYEILPRERAIDRVLKDLAVTPRKATDIVDVAYTTDDPVLAQRLSNLVVETFRAVQERAVQAQAQRSAEFLDGQRARIADLQRGAQEELASFQKNRRMGTMAGRLDARQSDLATLDMRLSELDADRRVYQTLLRRLETGSEQDHVAALREVAYAPELANDEVIQRLYPQVLQYQVRVDSMKSGPHALAAGNPDLIQAVSVLHSTREELADAVRARLTSTEARRTALLATRARTTAAAEDTPALDAEEARLQHRVDILVTATDQLQVEYQKARLAQELAAGDVRIVDAAPLPYEPYGLPDAGKIGLGLFLGLLLGLATAAALDSMSRVIHRPEEVERLLAVRPLGVIPPMGNGNGRSPLRRALQHRHRHANGNGNAEPALLGTEPFRRVYSSLVPGWGYGRRTILVTSTIPQEGKTLTAANLAVIFAGEGARVLLIDADIRRPSLHRAFHTASAPGLRDVFVDPPAPIPNVFSFAPSVERGAPIERPDPAHEAIQSTCVPGVSLLAAGSRVGSLADLKSTRMRDLLTRVGEGFDVIILDSPPVLVSADAAILAPLVDGVIFVIRAGQTERHAIEQAHEQLGSAGGHVLGTVLNDPAGEISKYGRYYYFEEETAKEVS